MKMRSVLALPALLAMLSGCVLTPAYHYSGGADGYYYQHSGYTANRIQGYYNGYPYDYGNGYVDGYGYGAPYGYWGPVSTHVYYEHGRDGDYREHDARGDHRDHERYTGHERLSDPAADRFHNRPQDRYRRADTARRPYDNPRVNRSWQPSPNFARRPQAAPQPQPRARPSSSNQPRHDPRDNPPPSRKRQNWRRH